jgi:hypothetical protein
VQVVAKLDVPLRRLPGFALGVLVRGLEQSHWLTCQNIKSGTRPMTNAPAGVPPTATSRER